MIKFALSVRLKAKPGKEKELAEFIQSVLPLAESEPGTITWYAIQFNDSTFGIFDTFSDEEGRRAHLKGEIAQAITVKADELLAAPPIIEEVKVLAAKTHNDSHKEMREDLEIETET